MILFCSFLLFFILAISYLKLNERKTEKGLKLSPELKLNKGKKQPTCPQGAVVRVLQVHQSGDEVCQHTPGIQKKTVLIWFSLQKLMHPLIRFICEPLRSVTLRRSVLLIFFYDQIYSRALEECYTEEESSHIFSNQIYSRALEECYMEEKWAVEQCFPHNFVLIRFFLIRSTRGLLKSVTLRRSGQWSSAQVSVRSSTTACPVFFFTVSNLALAST